MMYLLAINELHAVGLHNDWTVPLKEIQRSEYREIDISLMAYGVKGKISYL